MSYKEIQVPKATIVNIYGFRVDALEQLQSRPAKKAEELRKASWDWAKEEVRRERIYMDVHGLSQWDGEYGRASFQEHSRAEARLYRPNIVKEYLDEAKSMLKAASLAETLTMTPAQVEKMEVFQRYAIERSVAYVEMEVKMPKSLYSDEELKPRRAPSPQKIESAEEEFRVAEEERQESLQKVPSPVEPVAEWCYSDLWKAWAVILGVVGVFVMCAKYL